ncbi:RNA methyltransferase [Hydrogenophaga sp. 5NK40-0174]|uniref:TrmH family RNA methyltransferase n=1 Tax=Hydrogenophaga sp. 5NK40-0174 TaxID=3127649 RepID=UPI003108AA33
MSEEHTLIQSRENALLKRLRQLARDTTAYRKLGQVFLEGDHLCRALLERGGRPEVVVVKASAHGRMDSELLASAPRLAIVADELWDGLSGLDSPAPIGFLLAVPQPPSLGLSEPSVVLDRLQDAGNVGSILRSAAAFGFKQVLAIKGTAGLWSPKVVRAGMGAHFGLTLHEGLSADDVNQLSIPLLATSSHRGQWLHESALPWPCAWMLGHEGQGLQTALEARAAQSVRIGQPGGEESLNVAAAAAICLHASAVGRH